MKEKNCNKKKKILLITGIITLGVIVSLFLDKRYKESNDSSFARNKLNIWDGASEATKAHLQEYQSKLDDIKQYINDIYFYNKTISSDNIEEITDKVIKFGSWFMVEMLVWEEEQEKKLNDLYSWDGAKENDNYQKQLMDIKNKSIAKGQEFYDCCLGLNNKIELIYKTNTKINTNDYNEIENIYTEMDLLAITSFAKSTAEQEKLLGEK